MPEAKKEARQPQYLMSHEMKNGATMPPAPTPAKKMLVPNASSLSPSQ